MLGASIMENIKSKIEIAANVAIIIVAIMIGAVLINKYYFVKDDLNSPKLPIGAVLTIPEVDWSKSKKTLVLALKEGCRYCTESAAFYQRLIPATMNGNTQLLVVFPDPTESGKKYLDSLGVHTNNYRQISFNSIGVVATPTLLLVNQNGKVTEGWIGKLPEEKELEVVEKMK